MSVSTAVVLCALTVCCLALARAGEIIPAHKIVHNTGENFTPSTHLHAIYHDMLKYFDHMLTEKILEKKDNQGDKSVQKDLKRAGQFVDSYRNLLVHEGLDLDLKEIISQTSKYFSVEQLENVSKQLKELEDATQGMNHEERNTYWKKLYIQSAHDSLLNSKDMENKGQFMHFLRVRSMLQSRFNLLREKMLN